MHDAEEDIHVWDVFERVVPRSKDVGAGLCSALDDLRLTLKDVLGTSNEFFPLERMRLDSTDVLPPSVLVDEGVSDVSHLTIVSTASGWLPYFDVSSSSRSKYSITLSPTSSGSGEMRDSWYGIVSPWL